MSGGVSELQKITTTATTYLNITGTSSGNICEDHLELQPIHIFYLVVIGLLIICNAVILIAVAKTWAVLQQNVVYRYLVSCLVSVITFCLVSMIDMVKDLSQWNSAYVEGGLLQRYDSSNFSHQAILRRESYIKGFVVALLLIIQFNVAAVLYAVADNTFYVSRSGQFTDGDRMKIFGRHSKRWKRYKSFFLIAFAWVVPLVLSIPVGFTWNCIDQCQCLPMYRRSPYCPSTDEHYCSRVWPPMSRSYVVVTTILYFITMICMVVTLISTIRKFYISHAPAEASSTEEGENSGVADKVNNANSSIRRMEPTKTSIRQQQHSAERDRSTSIASTVYGKKRRLPLDDTIKLLIVLTVSLFISMTPTMLVWFLDSFLKKAPTIDALMPSLAITFVYAACLPFIMLKYMSGLRNACIKVLMKCPCLRTTSVTTTTRSTHGITLAPPNGHVIVENIVAEENEIQDVSVVLSETVEENLNKE